ncbi:MAG: hypothetical protein JKY02_09220 [Flavobacteriaceae bacterium]|nr:hypothetical protein [Flavobacteriaceae bacterium]
MPFKKLLLFLIIFPLVSFTAHKYYLSLTQIEYNKENESLQIIINVFMDDIETALNKEYAIDLKLTTKEELKDADAYFEKYLQDKLNFSVNKNNVVFTYLGKEYEGDLVYFYLEITNIKKPTSLSLSNKILLKHFDKQQNVVKMKVGKKRRSKILNKKNDKALLNF